MLEFRSGGRRVSLDQFFENLKNEAIEAGAQGNRFKSLDHGVPARDGSHAPVCARSWMTVERG